MAAQADNEPGRPSIPLTLHRIWLDEPMPPVFAAYGEAWKQTGWLVWDWQSSADLPPLRNADLFDRAPEITPDWRRFQADVLRLELLEQFGGVYVDCDVEPIRPLDPLVDGHECLIGYSPQHTNGKHPLTNAVMAAVPGHPFITACIDALPESVERYGHRSLAVMAGPWHLTRTYEDGEWDIATPTDLYDGTYFAHHWNTARRKAGKGLG